MENREFEGKVALVTGGSAGMGQATAIAFAEAGARVVIADLEPAEETAARIRKFGGECLFVRTDVSRSDEVKALVQKTMETYGRLDCAVNNAAIETQKDFLDFTEADWDRTIDVNLKGVWLCMMNELPPMLAQGGGAIVNIASVAGLIGFPMHGPYVASKHGVVGLSKAASLEFARRGVRVNTVCPGTIDTPMLAKANVRNPENTNMAIAMTPIGRLGRSEEVAAASLWLCSGKASFVTGITMSVDGGWSQH